MTGELAPPNDSASSGRGPRARRARDLGAPRDLRRDDANGSVEQEVEVDICPEQSGYILSVGPMSIWLDGETAEDVVEMLERAIASRASDSPASDADARCPRLEIVAPRRRRGLRLLLL